MAAAMASARALSIVSSLSPNPSPGKLSQLGSKSSSSASLDPLSDGNAPTSSLEQPRTVLITGATSGIGKETARVLALQGHTVIIASRDSKKVKAVVQELRQLIDPRPTPSPTSISSSPNLVPSASPSPPTRTSAPHQPRSSPAPTDLPPGSPTIAPLPSSAVSIASATPPPPRTPSPHAPHLAEEVALPPCPLPGRTASPDDDDAATVVTARNASPDLGPSAAAKGKSPAHAPSHDSLASAAPRLPLSPGDAPSRVLGLRLDLASLHGVRTCATELERRTRECGWPRVDCVVLNAGILGPPLLTLTEDGIEKTFAVNHMGHYFLLKLLLPGLVETAKANGRPSRVIALSSATHDPANRTRVPPPIFNPHDWASPTSYHPLRAYSSSKLAAVLTALDVAQTHSPSHIIAMAYDPGFVGDTGLYRGPGPLMRVLARTVMAADLQMLAWWYGSMNPCSGVARSGGFLARLAGGEVGETGGYYVIEGRGRESTVAGERERQVELRRFLDALLVEKGFGSRCG
ncbi:hypothetical protein HDU96_010208 [Phlyctochytrium bullatum]|nr:hypothetical protein HDU96_010208 [Phlyctochytrium bullatum]